MRSHFSRSQHRSASHCSSAQVPSAIEQITAPMPDDVPCKSAAGSSFLQHHRDVRGCSTARSSHLGPSRLLWCSSDRHRWSPLYESRQDTLEVRSERAKIRFRRILALYSSNNKVQLTRSTIDVIITDHTLQARGNRRANLTRARASFRMR